MCFPLGEIASLGAAACWAVGLTLFRRDVRAIGARQVNLFKGLVGTTLFLVCLSLTGARPIPADAQVFLLLSGVVGLALGDTLLFRALADLGPHRTALVFLLGPVLTAAGGWTFLGESLRAGQMAGIVLAVAGVAVVVRSRPAGPQAGEPTLRGTLFGLAAAACQAGGVLLAKRGLDGADPLAATALRLGAATAALALVGLFRHELRRDLGRLFAPGPLARLLPAVLVATFLGLWLMQLGIKHTQSAVANALHSTTPLFTLPIALFLLRERHGPLVIVGSFLGVGGVALLLLT